jgi:hypothetical protein
MRLKEIKTRGRRRSVTSILVLLVFAPLALDGCVSIGISRSELPSPKPATATLEVRIYESPGERKQDRLSARRIVSELFLTKGPDRLVHTATETAWSVSDLAPGAYSLVVGRWIDEKGESHNLANTETQHFRLRAGEKVTAGVVLKRAPVGTIVGVSAGVAVTILVILAIAAAVTLSGFSLGSETTNVSNPSGEATYESPVLRPTPSTRN